MDHKLIEIIVLGIIQGISEFLPISSSGHLVLFQSWFGMKEETVLVSVVLHAGSLCSIVCYYFKDLLTLLRRERRRVLVLIAMGTIPLVVVGKFVKDLMDAAETRPDVMLWVVAGGFTVSFILLSFVFKKSDEVTTIDDIGIKRSVMIGIVQVLAITPGVSRSGSTISVAGRQGISPDAGARFSFFLGILAISAAMTSKYKDLIRVATEPRDPQSLSIFHLSVGFFISFVVGYFALSVLIKVLKRGQLKYFGYYCLIMAIVTATYAALKN